MVSIEHLKTLKCYTFSRKKVFQLFAVSVVMKMKKIFGEKESIEILKMIGFINIWKSS